MSEEHHDGDFSFNELIENILTNDKEEHHPEEHSGDGGDGSAGANTTDQGHADGEEDIEMPDFDGTEDLVAAVANAMQDIDHGHEDSDVNTHEHAPGNEEASAEDQQHNEWARILQQGLMQEEEGHEEEQGHAPEEHHEAHTADNLQNTLDQLDRDDENLRMAIMQSLHGIEEEPEVQAPETAAPKTKNKAKKSKTKAKTKTKTKTKDKDEKASPKKKKTAKHKKKDKEVPETELNFNDVIEGLMKERDDQHEHTGDEDDADARALVEETLKAFERELLSPSTEETATKTKSKAAKKDKKEKKDKAAATKKDKLSSTKKQAKADTKKKKKKKTKAGKKAEKEQSQDEYPEDDFSKVLADMVNQVVSTSLGDESAEGHEQEDTTTAAATNDNERPHPISIPTWSHTQITPYRDESRAEITTTAPAAASSASAATGADEPFDLNQIMQNAMAMAFQEQNDQHFDSSVMEEFNRSLGNFTVSDLLSEQTTAKAKPAKKRAPKKKKAEKPKTSKNRKIVIQPVETVKKPKIPKKPAKPKKTREQIFRKKYKAVVTEAAKVARKRNREKNRATRDKLKEEHDKRRAEKKLLKKEALERQAAEQKELAEIVARGPPYPADLRITKKGTPKKPYRRWTPEEMEKRAQMALEKPEKPVKVRKERKKKTKKMKRIPLAALRKIPLFNFVKGNVQIPSKELNDIEGTLSKIQLPHGNNTSANVPGGVYIPGKAIAYAENIAFHPPWMIPEHPPLSLPVSIWTPKVVYDRYMAGRRHISRARKPVISDAMLRSEILPKTLATVINTLKVAAKARIANGASPEQTLKYIMVIVERTKRSIAQAISQRNHSLHQQSVVKEETKTDGDSGLKKMPIFSLSKIKEVQQNAIAEGNTDAIHSISVKQEQSQEPLESVIDPELMGEKSDEVVTSGESAHDETQEKSVGQDESVVPTSEEVEAADTDGAAKAPVTALDVEQRSLLLRGALLGGRFSEYTSKQPSNTETPANSATNNHVIEIEDETDVAKTIPKPSKIPLIKEEASRDNFVKVEDMVERLMNDQLEPSQDDDKLTSGLSKIITNTISGLLPRVKKENSRENNISLIKVRNQTLNLDGLAPLPLTKGRPLSTIKTEPPASTMRQARGIRANMSAGPKIIAPVAPVEPAKPVPKFDIPDFSGLAGRKGYLMKLVRNTLSEDDMKQFNRELNRERKRKWREVNAIRNWSIDYKSRIRKRANLDFGEAESEKKTKFLDEEFAAHEKKVETLTAAAGSSTKGTTPAKDGKISTISDMDILKILSMDLDKLDVARKLERELNEEQRRLDEERSTPKRTVKRRKLNAQT
ncbi:Spp41 protein [Maudiozyma humilis]|uniref:Spp41 protein n=1 Tax=Maudiozyma humilis TaxID=51915 RepID=A0AAV5S0N3_MAUHU|nr:Spp41 protein [Kazachstania humilis]